MKFYFLCYNYYTYYVSSLYARYLRKKGHKCLLFLYEYEVSFVDINEGLWDEVIYIRHGKYKVPRRAKFLSFIRGGTHGYSRRYFGTYGVQELKKYIKETEKNILVVYKDNDVIFASAIEKFKLLTNYKGKVVLIEEGLALYVKSLEMSFIYRNKFLLQGLHFLLGLSFFGTGRLKQGYHPELDVIIAKEKEKLDAIQQKKVGIPQTKDLFTNQYIEMFLKEAINITDLSSENLLKFDYLYIGQPLAADNVCSYEEEILFLESIFSKIPKEKQIAIKPHPRDDIEKYCRMKNKFDNLVILEDTLLKLPVEIVYGMISGNPIVLTPYSSAYKTIHENYSSSNTYLLYKLLGKEDLNNKLSGTFNFDELLNVPTSNEEYLKLIFRESKVFEKRMRSTTNIKLEIDTLIKWLLN